MIQAFTGIMYCVNVNVSFNNAKTINTGTRIHASVNVNGFSVHLAKSSTILSAFAFLSLNVQKITTITH